MKFRLWLFVFITMLNAQVFAQDAAGAAAAGMAGAAIINEGVWAAVNNQAGLASVESFAVGVCYQNRFMVQQLGDKGFVGAYRLGAGTFGLSFKSFGYSAYSNSKIGLAYAIGLNEKLFVGAQGNYHTVRIGEGYGSRQVFTVEGGLLYKMNSHLVIAFHAINPTSAELLDYNNERLPATLRAAVGYRFSSRLMLVGQVSKISDQKAFVQAGMEYKFPQHLILRTGINSDTRSASFGFGWDFGKWQLDLASSYHQILGFTPQLSLMFRTETKK